MIAWLCSACGGGKAVDNCRDLDGGLHLCGPTSVQVPVLPGSPSPEITAQIDGREARVLVDTGAEATVMSSTWLGVADAQWVRAHEICVLDLCLYGEQIYAHDTEFSQPAAEDTNGFIGMATLRHFVLEFDHDSSVRLAQGAPACAGEQNPLSYNQDSVPLIDVSVDGHDFPATVIDSGSTFSVLSQPSLDLLDPYITAQSMLADLCTADGCQTGVAHTSAVMQYCVAGHCQANVPVKFPVFDGVGSSYLYLEHTAFDFPNSELVFCE
ncbi:MAG TPA: hypothetical protein VGM29_08495 [Polyangiaceae bacterium]